MIATSKSEKRADRLSALEALKRAIIAGAAWRYDQLVAAALASGATDEEIDLMAHQAIQALLTGAEEPLTSRDLNHPRHGGDRR